jgi:hypothetical protein
MEMKRNLKTMQFIQNKNKKKTNTKTRNNLKKKQKIIKKSLCAE